MEPPGLKDDMHLSPPDSWAAVHLPAIEELLKCMPDEGQSDATAVLPGIEPASTYTGVQDSTAFFQSVMSALPPFSQGPFAQSAWTPMEEDRATELQLHMALTQSPGDSSPYWSKHGLDETLGVRQGNSSMLLSHDEIDSWNPLPQNINHLEALRIDAGCTAESPHPAFLATEEACTWGEGLSKQGHKRVPRKINIQEEFSDVRGEITTAMIRNVPNQLNRKQFVERLYQLGF
mmetsp:Transcript_27585/g.64293  ORF Transcript_27585/g.64293 Transcript_27585/m.64293 type:complete len:233 (-) Transcript_27585:21-719(-)